jgi:PAS domain S-box-containing protein
MKGVIQRRLDEVEARFKVLMAGQIDAVAGPQGPILLSRAQSALAAAVQAAERNLRAVSSSDVELVSTMEGDGVVRFVNSGIARVLGWTPEDCIGQPATNFLHPDDRGLFNSLLARATSRAGRSVGGGMRVLDSGGGSRRLYVALSNHLDDPSIGLVVGRASDESESYHGSRPYRMSFELAPDALIVADAEGLTVSLNPEAARLFGYPRESVLGRPVAALFRLDDDGGRSLLGVLDGSPPAGAVAEPHPRSTSRVVCVRSDGTTFPAEIWRSLPKDGLGAGGPVAIALRDLTVQSRLEEARRESEAILASTFDSIGDGVVATDARGRVSRINRAAERLTGWAAVEAVGRPVAQVFTTSTEGGSSHHSPSFEELLEGTAQIPPNGRLVGRNGTERL